MASYSQQHILSSAPFPTLRRSFSAHNPNFTIPAFSCLRLKPQTLTMSPNLKSPEHFLPNSTASAPAATASAPAATTSHEPRSLKSRLKRGETLYGIFLLTFSPTIAEIAGLAGYDFAVVDMEHGHGGIHSALPCLHALAAAGAAAILRLPESSASWAKKALDLGPQGIMFPMIDSPKSARKAVSYCQFPPKGVRGSAHMLVRASSYGLDEGYQSRCEEDVLVMCQVESEEGVRKAEEISGVEGVDCVQMGPLDLSASMGHLWDPGHKKVREALQGAEKAVLKGGAYLSGFVMPHDGAGELRRRGYHMVAGAADVGLFRSAAVEDVRRFRATGGSGLGEEESVKLPAEEKYWSE